MLGLRDAVRTHSKEIRREALFLEDEVTLSVGEIEEDYSEIVRGLLTTWNISSMQKQREQTKQYAAWITATKYRILNRVGLRQYLGNWHGLTFQEKRDFLKQQITVNAEAHQLYGTFILLGDLEQTVQTMLYASN